jgi:2-oxoglutarate ferredoxin oxidoreductase subunit alpha
VGERIFIDGNTAAALGRVRRRDGSRGIDHAVVIACGSLPKHCRSTASSATGSKYAIIQAEDELASIGIVIGAAWNGARAFTATSDPAFR